MARKPQVHRYPVVHVVWRDAFSKDAWKGIHDELKFCDHAVIDTVGYLVRKDKLYIGVANSVSREDEEHEDEACCTVLIPRGMVVSMKVLVRPCARSKR